MILVLSVQYVNRAAFKFPAHHALSANCRLQFKSQIRKRITRHCLTVVAT